jgi:hypothetical protein
MAAKLDEWSDALKSLLLHLYIQFKLMKEFLRHFFNLRKQSS